MIRRIGYMLSLTLVVWAATVVPMPFYEVQPGSAHPVQGMITISASASAVDGDFSLLTTRQRTPNVVETVWVGLHPGRELHPAQQRVPGGIDLDQYFDIQRQAFDTSFTTALVIAAEEAGHDVELRTRTVVARVMPGGPSEGLLLAGDTIVAVDGTSVSSAVEVIDVLDRSAEERPVDVEVRRDDASITVTVHTRQMPETDRPVLGILVETLAVEPELPFEAELDSDGIMGPSAGLMLALTATDLLLEENLAGGRVIAGTGTLAADGTVGRVSGVEQKARAAIAADADLLLVPLEQLEEAAAAAAAGVEVVGVGTFQDALDAVRGTTDGVAAPH